MISGNARTSDCLQARHNFLLSMCAYLYVYRLDKILYFPTVRQVLSEKADQIFSVPGSSPACQRAYESLGKVQRAAGVERRVRRAKLRELTTVKW